MKTKHASLVKCLRITAYTNRFVQKLKKIPTPKGVPTSDEIQVARKRWIKALQGKHFLHTKNGKTKLNKTTAENFLNLKLDEGGIISCYGRMTNANLPQEKTTPILLPQKEKITTCRSQSYTVSTKYWIVRGRIEVKNVLRKCRICPKYQGGPFKMPPKLTRSAPFKYTDLDYFGPPCTSSWRIKRRKRCGFAYSLA